MPAQAPRPPQPPQQAAKHGPIKPKKHKSNLPAPVPFCSTWKSATPSIDVEISHTKHPSQWNGLEENRDELLLACVGALWVGISFIGIPTVTHILRWFDFSKSNVRDQNNRGYHPGSPCPVPRSLEQARKSGNGQQDSGGRWHRRRITVSVVPFSLSLVEATGSALGAYTCVYAPILRTRAHVHSFKTPLVGRRSQAIPHDRMFGFSREDTTNRMPNHGRLGTRVAMMNPLLKGMPTNTNMTLHGRNTTADNAPLLASQQHAQAAQAARVAEEAAKMAAAEADTQAALALDVVPTDPMAHMVWSPVALPQVVPVVPSPVTTPPAVAAVAAVAPVPVRILQRTIVKAAVARDIPKVSPTPVVSVAGGEVTPVPDALAVVTTIVPQEDPRVTALEVQLTHVVAQLQTITVQVGQQTSMHAGFARSIDDRMCQVEKKCTGLETALTQLMMRLSQVESMQRQNHEDHATLIHDLERTAAKVASSEALASIDTSSASSASTTTTTLLPSMALPLMNDDEPLKELTARVTRLEDHVSTIPELPPKMAALYSTCQDHMVQNQARLDSLESRTNDLILNVAETAEQMDFKLLTQMQSQVSFFGTVSVLKVPLFLDEMLEERPVQDGPDPRELVQGTKVLLFLPMKSVGKSLSDGQGTKGDVLREVTYCACRIMTDPVTAHIREFFIPLSACVEWLRQQDVPVRSDESIHFLGDFTLA